MGGGSLTELSRKRQLQMMHAARTNTEYRLRHDDGSYLHMSGHGRTNEEVYAWIGTDNKLRALRKAIQLPADLRVVKVVRE